MAMATNLIDSVAAPTNSTSSSVVYPSSTQTVSASASSQSAGGSATTSSSSGSLPSSSSSNSSDSGGGSNSISSSGSDVTVIVKNSCIFSNLKVFRLTNGGGDQESQDVSASSSHEFQVDSNWSGRFWGCHQVEANCDQYGSAASLAEFLFKCYEGSDFYDISFVDGFNLLLGIELEGRSGGGDNYNCGSPTRSSLPTCSDELKGNDGSSSQYADKFKSGCPDACSYAYDDAKSTYGCKASKYTVNF
ncbi:thaumatin [Phascolomyces articulosus]|uniref:Thaumatin n=1 Tax=Phascolomyces articulosus TaxID=60185 RepID=A0AAD5P7V5_9FUNG|nr:thaumatin [Phascolomyces articulosus]